MARLLRQIALATTFLLAAAGGETFAQTPTDKLSGAGAFDTDAWFFQGPDGATFSRETCAGFTGSCARIRGAHLGARKYDAQLVYWSTTASRPTFITLQGGKNYRIRLNASASVANKTVEVALEDGIYRVVGARTFTLGTSPAVQTAEPIAIPASGGASVTVRVNVGGADNDGVTFSIDDLVVLEEAGAPPPPPGSEVNLLAAGDFESNPGSDVWNHWGTGTRAITDCLTGKCFQVTGTDFGPDPWSTQLVKWNGSSRAVFSLDPAKQYTFKFVGRSAVAGGVVQLMLQRPDDSAEGIISHDFTLTPSAAPYEFSVPVAAADGLTFKLNFIRGSTVTAGEVQTIEVDDLQLLEATPAQ